MDPQYFRIKYSFEIVTKVPSQKNTQSGDLASFLGCLCLLVHEIFTSIIMRVFMNITKLEGEIPLFRRRYGILPVLSYSSMLNSVLGKLYLLLGSLPYLFWIAGGRGVN